jgi:hypothetical protein
MPVFHYKIGKERARSPGVKGGEGSSSYSLRGGVVFFLKKKLSQNFAILCEFFNNILLQFFFFS